MPNNQIKPKRIFMENFFVQNQVDSKLFEETKKLLERDIPYFNLIQENTDEIEQSEKDILKFQTSINHIETKNYPELEQKFKKNLLNQLSKMNSSNKTKVLHHLIENNKMKLGWMAMEYSTAHSIPGVIQTTGNKIDRIVLDLNFINDEIGRSTISKLIQKLQMQFQAKTQNTYIIDELSDYKANKLEKNITETFEELIGGIDYMKALDAYYYVFLTKLVELSFDGKGQEKIYLLTKDIFDIIIEKSLTGVIVDPTLFKRVEIASNAVFMKSYLKINESKMLLNLKKAFGEEEINYIFSKVKLKEIKNIYDISIFLKKLDILDITPNILKQRVKRVTDDSIEKQLELPFQYFVSYLISCLYSNELFTSNTIDKERQQRLEKLVLNFKSKLVIKG